jgi:hypothetical protein
LFLQPALEIDWNKVKPCRDPVEENRIKLIPKGDSAPFQSATEKQSRH